MAYFHVDTDFEVPEHAGAGGLYQIAALQRIDEDGNEEDVTDRIDVGMFFTPGNQESLIKYVLEVFVIPDEESIEIEFD